MDLSEVASAGLGVRWLGRVDYRDAVALQRQLRDHSTKDHLLLLEHDHVVTLSRRTPRDHLLVDVEAMGAAVVDTDRGGDITYHGPGQLVGYPILTVPGKRGGGMADTAAYVDGIEQVLIDVLADLGVEAGRLPRCTGVWVDCDSLRPRKIAAIGVRITKGRSMHGFALNVDPDLAWFDRIVPCGITDKGVTSLAAEGVEVSMRDVVDLVATAAAQRWGGGRPVDRADVAWRVPTTDLAPFTRGEGPGTPVGRQGVGHGEANPALSFAEQSDGTSVRLLGRLAEAGVSADPVRLKARKPEWMRVPLDTGRRTGRSKRRCATSTSSPCVRRRVVPTSPSVGTTARRRSWCWGSGAPARAGSVTSTRASRPWPIRMSQLESPRRSSEWGSPTPS